MIETIDLNTYYDIHLHCPFCGKPASNEEEVLGCSHLLYIWLNEGFYIHMSERVDKVLSEKGVKVLRADGEIMLEMTNDSEGDIDNSNLQSDILTEFPDHIIFKQKTPPPGMEEVFTAFSFSDEEHQDYR